MTLATVQEELMPNARNLLFLVGFGYEFLGNPNFKLFFGMISPLYLKSHEISLQELNSFSLLCRYSVEVVVPVQKTYQIREHKWCWSVPPRCTRLKIAVKTVNETRNVTKSRPVTDCCAGYAQNKDGTRCIPVCSTPCVHGVCVAPEECKCEKHYGGPFCNISKCESRCLGSRIYYWFIYDCFWVFTGGRFNQRSFLWFSYSLPFAALGRGLFEEVRLRRTSWLRSVRRTVHMSQRLHRKALHAEMSAKFLRAKLHGEMSLSERWSMSSRVRRLLLYCRLDGTAVSTVTSSFFQCLFSWCIKWPMGFIDVKNHALPGNTAKTADLGVIAKTAEPASPRQGNATVLRVGL